MATVGTDTSLSSGGGQTIATAISSAVSVGSSAWGTSQDVAFTAVGQTLSLPAIGVLDIAPTLKTIVIRNNGVNAFTVALSGGALNSAIGTTVSPGSIWTFTAQTLTTANVISSASASQQIAGEQGTSYASATATPTASNITAATSILVPGLSFIAGDTQTYLVQAGIRALSNSNAFIVFALFDSLAPTVPIINSEGMGSGTTSGANNQSTSVLSGFYSLTAGKTYQIRCWNPGSVFSATVASDLNGRSSLSWSKVTGQIPVSAVAGANTGDIKFGAQLIDHANWILLDGRLKTVLTVAQQAAATALGYGVNIPDMRGRMPIGVGGTLNAAINSSGGVLTIAQNQLPNTTIAATPNSTFTPAGNVSTTVNAIYHSATGDGFNGGRIQLTDRAAFTVTNPSELTVSASFNGSAGTLPNYTTASLNGGVAQQNHVPPYFAGNWFVWLGPSAATMSIGQPGTPPKVTTITASGTFIKDPLSTYAIIKAVGGGGSAGGANATGAGQASVAASGGSGTYLEIVMTAAQLGASQPVAIGAGGVAATAGGLGNGGGVTSMGTLFSIPGGSGGGISIANSTVAQGGAAVAGLATITVGSPIINLAGQGSESAYGSFSSLYSFSRGGSNPLGNAYPGGFFNVGGASQAGTGYGSGSRGGINQASAAAQGSIAGQPGIMIITEYYQ